MKEVACCYCSEISNDHSVCLCVCLQTSLLSMAVVLVVEMALLLEHITSKLQTLANINWLLKLVIGFT